MLELIVVTQLGPRRYLDNRALWSLLAGLEGLLKGRWGVLAEGAIRVPGWKSEPKKRNIDGF